MTHNRDLFHTQNVTLISGSASSRAGELFLRMAVNLARGRAPLFARESEAEIAHITAGKLGEEHRVVVVSITEPEAALRAQLQTLDRDFDPEAVFGLRLDRDSGGTAKLFDSILDEAAHRDLWDPEAGEPLSVFFYGAVCAFTSTQNVNRYADVARLMRVMKDFAAENQLRLFCLMPVGKNTAGYDPKERILGATAWGDMADLILDVQIPSADPTVIDPSTTNRQLWVCPKNRPVTNYRAAVTETGRFIVSEIAFAGQSRRQPSKAFEALNTALAERWSDLKSFRTSHIPGWLNDDVDCSTSTIKRWVKYALDEGMIERRGTGPDIYYIPQTTYFQTM